jgi:1-deoxy-D-xylulose-5-phosphate synthase
MHAIPLGKAEIRRHSSKPSEKIAILSFGSMLAPALEAGDMLDATVVNMRFVKPIDHALIEKLLNDHILIVTLEENAVMGGAGSAVMEALQSIQQGLPADYTYAVRTLCLGLPDRFIEHGVHETMLSECGLDAQGIVASIHKFIN